MEDEESSWVFDSLVCFLNGPIWSAPLDSFIEENSLIFEPNVTESPEYRKIFNDFKNLVDFMLGNFMEDIGITPQQFEHACRKGTQGGITLQFDQSIFEQIWAANDYDMFKRMMTQKNVELQLQALELIEQKYGITPAVFMPDKEIAHGSQTKTPEKKKSVLEAEIMEEVVEKFESKDDIEKVKQPILDQNYLLKEKHILEKKLQEAFKKNLTFAEKPNEILKQENGSENVEVVQIEKNASQTNKSEKLSDTPRSSIVEVDSLEMKKRQEYLRAQRDKLVALKKEARKKQLQNDSTLVVPKEKNNSRPKSAKKAAETAMAGTVPNIEPHDLAIRRALVEKLKSEIIHKKE